MTFGSKSAPVRVALDRPYRRRIPAAFAALLALGSATALVVGPATPAFAENPTAGVQIAYQGSNGLLYGYGAVTNGLMSHQGMPTHAAQLAPGTSPAIQGRSDGVYVTEFQYADNTLGLVEASPSFNEDPLTLSGGAMAPGTSPALADWQNHQLTMDMFQRAQQPGEVSGRLGSTNRPGPLSSTYWVAAGTSPSITSVKQSYNNEPFVDPDPKAMLTAIQGWDGCLWLHGVRNTRVNYSNGTCLTVAPGTSPSIASDGKGHWQVAFQGVRNHLWFYTSAGSIGDTNMTMMAGTSPAMIADHDGSNHYEIAFQAWDGALWAFGDMYTGRAGNGLGVAPNTSPSITALPNHGYEIAWNASTTNHLWTIVNNSSWTDTQKAMAPNSNPAITTMWPLQGGTTPPPPPHGYKDVRLYNCVGSPGSGFGQPRTISLWARDVTAGAAFTRQGSIVTAWQGTSGCVGAPFTYTPPVNGHVYQIEAIDFNHSGCSDDPYGSCQVLTPFQFTADTAGVDQPITIG
jgi:hypothetical protein